MNINTFSSNFRDTTAGHSLWLMPKGPSYASLKNCIHSLAKKHRGPLFEPHLTLLGELSNPLPEILKKTQTLASTVQPFQINLIKIGAQDSYFTCLYIAAKKIKALTQFHQSAARVFADSNVRPFFGHLSLFYGTVSPEIKKNIMSGIDVSLPITFTADSVHVVCTSGSPPNWHIVQSIPLGSRI